MLYHDINKILLTKTIYIITLKRFIKKNCLKFKIKYFLILTFDETSGKGFPDPLIVSAK